MDNPEKKILQSQPLPQAMLFFGISCLLVLFATFIRNYLYAEGDQGLQLALIEWLKNPETYANDIITIAFREYRSFLFPLILFLSRLIPRYELLLVLHLISLLGFFYLFMVLVHKLTGDVLSSVFAGLIIAFPLPILAGSPIISSQFIPSSVALPLSVLALIFYFREKYWLIGVVLGLGVLLHPLECGVAFLVLFLAMCILTGVNLFRKSLIPLVCFLVAASPMIYTLLVSSGSGVLSRPDPEWIKVLRLRSPHHIFPLSWSAFTYVKFLLFLFPGIVGMLASKRDGRSSPLLAKKIPGLIISIFLVCMAGFVFVELYPITFFLKAQLFRSSNIILLLFIPFIGYLVALGLRKMQIFPTLFAGLLLFSLITRAYFWSTLATLGFLTTFLKKPYNTLLTVTVFIGVIVWLVLKELPTVPLFVKTAIFTPSDFETLFVLFTLGFFIWNFTGNRKEKAYLSSRKGLSAMILLIWALAGGYSLWSFWSNDFKEAREKNRFWIQAQEWARQHTPTESLFLVAPYLDNFRTHSFRNEFGTWKDGTLANFSPEYARKWWIRISLLGMRNEKQFQGYRAIRQLQKIWIDNLQYNLALLINDYKVSYLVSDKPLPTDLPFKQIYRNQKFCIYKLQP